MTNADLFIEKYKELENLLRITDYEEVLIFRAFRPKKLAKCMQLLSCLLK